MDRKFDIAGPPFDTDLYPLDHIAPPVYSRRVLIFELPPEYDHERITSVLLEGLQATVSEIPTLASTIVNVPETPGEQRGRRGLKQHGRAHLIIKDLTADLDFNNLKAVGFSQHVLPTEKLSPAPPVSPPPADACFIQANFIRGGLLLMICVHHVVADGSAITTVIETLASKCLQVQEINTTGDSLKSTLLSSTALDRSLLSQGDPNGKLERHSAYIDMSELPSAYRSIHGKGQVVASETFRISPVAQQRLKALASSPTNKTIGTQPYITTHDAICALVWRSVMSARHAAGVIPVSATVSFYNPVNIRNAMSPPLPAKFIGNAWIPVNPDIPLSVLLAEDGISAAAHLLRSTITATSDGSVRDLIGACHATPDLRTVQIRCLFSLTTTQIMSTSYRKFNHAHDWGSVFGKYETFRLPNNAFPNGSAVVLPVLADGSWEVAITQEQSIMGLMKQDEMWLRYTHEGV